MRLTPKQQRFVEEYLIDLNGKQAAIRAGYAAPTAEVTASRLLRNVKVATAVQEAQDARSERTEITADRVLKEFARIAFYNPSRVFRVDDNGLPVIDFSNATEEDWRVVAEVSSERLSLSGENRDDGVTLKAKVKHQCKLSALNSLAKHLGMFTEKLEVSYADMPDAELNEEAARLGIRIDPAAAQG